ncbi:polysaccharide biosynthesis/export family protein [Rheinheimera baltica]|uniref:polysaccharide biosynthesis/export family protein n=1 Tax=Rheinheimera baltica TaxID=67576 RepID=UPI00273D1493|nr:polysaccharide biosynthesis/export family protein [Rheinheimera baltica]MDP5143095.1 polysaccharide biosynthesis/export family protein [Rheinheimera baltica]
MCAAKNTVFKRGTAMFVTLAAALLVTHSVIAQSFADLPSNQRAAALQSSQVQQLLNDNQNSTPTLATPQQNTNWQVGRYGPVQPGAADQSEAGSMLPFGADLFSGGFRGLRSDGLNPDYKVLPGDQITLRIWGAVEVDRVLPVDAQGNIFIPAVGPVKVMGTSHQQLDNLVRNAVRQVYPDNVQVYTNLQGVQPIAVFVTGYVRLPGRYAGVPADSALFFLDQAGGIDNTLGSYRQIKHIRDGEIVQTLDLYQFLLHGQLAHSQFKNGDTLLVEQRGDVVQVSGDVARSYQYELIATETATDLVNRVQLKPGVTHVLHRGINATTPYSDYLQLQNFAAVSLANGDELVFSVDQQISNIVVQVEGSFLGQSRFIVPRHASLQQVLNNIAIDPAIADISNISLRRVSIAERQRASLLESLRRLETTYLGAPSSTVEESAIRVREAELISQFVQKARQVQPNGRLVVADDNGVADIRMQDGDVITIPELSDAVLVSGEVFVPQSVVFNANKSLSDYIAAAGGYSQHADKGRILVVRPNGEIRLADDVEIRSGDEILILPKVSSKNLELASSISQILYQIAVATKVALDL